MRSSPVLAAVMAAAWAAGGSPAAAQPDKPKLDGAQFGRQLVGPRLDPADLKGRVVVVEYWGVH